MFYVLNEKSDIVLVIAYLIIISRFQRSIHQFKKTKKYIITWTIKAIIDNKSTTSFFLVFSGIIL